MCFVNGLKACAVTDMAVVKGNVVAETLIEGEAVKLVPVIVMPPDFVMTGAKPTAESGPVTVTVVPEEVAVKPFWPMAESILDATVLLLLLDEVAPVMISTPFTLMLETDVLLLLPETVMVAVALVACVVTTGVNPDAEAGPVIVTVLDEETAPYPPRLTRPATSLARLLELVSAGVEPDMIWKPFTVMPLTIVLLLPENVMVEVGSGGVVVTTGTTPDTEAGPLIVTVLPEAVAL